MITYGLSARPATDRQPVCRAGSDFGNLRLPALRDPDPEKAGHPSRHADVHASQPSLEVSRNSSTTLTGLLNNTKNFLAGLWDSPCTVAFYVFCGIPLGCAAAAMGQGVAEWIGISTAGANLLSTALGVAAGAGGPFALYKCMLK